MLFTIIYFWFFKLGFDDSNFIRNNGYWEIIDSVCLVIFLEGCKIDFDMF